MLTDERIGQRRFRQRAHDGGPFANAPRLDGAVHHVRIAGGKRLGNRARGSAEHQDSPIDRIRKRAPKNEVASRNSLTGVCDMRGPKRHPPLGIVVRRVVEQQIVHARLAQRFGGGWMLSTHATSSGGSAGAMSRFTTTGSCPLRTSTQLSGSS